ncbi:MAG: hypothetical protein LBV40_06470 [Methanomicrobiales archaeon]|nr:hypothetical protein [Methanomicrobiales archaeon]
MTAIRDHTKKSEYKTITFFCASTILLSECATWLWTLPKIFCALITITLFPCFVLSLFLWLNASEKERDIPFMGY